MEKITLDFSSCKRWYDIHEEIRIKFDFPEWYGKNLDALWDLMDEYFVLGNEPALITIIGTQKMSEEAKDTFKDINEITFARVRERASNVKIEILS